MPFAYATVCEHRSVRTSTLELLDALLLVCRFLHVCLHLLLESSELLLHRLHSIVVEVWTLIVSKSIEKSLSCMSRRRRRRSNGGLNRRLTSRRRLGKSRRTQRFEEGIRIVISTGHTTSETNTVIICIRSAQFDSLQTPTDLLTVGIGRFLLYWRDWTKRRGRDRACMC
jgi:hypothetical protein